MALVSKASALGNPAARPLAQICRQPHISTSRRGRARGPVDDALGQAGLHRQVAVVVASPVNAALLAADTEAVALLPQRLAEYFAVRLPVRWFPLPVDLPTVTIAQQWHARLDNDPSHRWLRGHVSASARREEGAGGP